jgi:hypothetical protein
VRKLADINAFGELTKLIGGFKEPVVVIRANLNCVNLCSLSSRLIFIQNLQQINGLFIHVPIKSIHLLTETGLEIKPDSLSTYLAQLVEALKQFLSFILALYTPFISRSIFSYLLGLGIS